MIYLATDLDREGEAIAWHLKEALGIPDERVNRVIFNAITKSEIQKAFHKPHAHRHGSRQRPAGPADSGPDRGLRDHRRCCGGRSPRDCRPVGCRSVAVRLVVEREREIEAFVPSEYLEDRRDLHRRRSTRQRCSWLGGKWNDFLHQHRQRRSAPRPSGNKWLAEHEAFVAELVELAGKKFEPRQQGRCPPAAEAAGVRDRRGQTPLTIPRPRARRRMSRRFDRTSGATAGLHRSRRSRRSATTSQPPAPFITSTLQQAASSRLGFRAQRTMRIAQSLYEVGHITYMRTDSTHLSADALTMARALHQQGIRRRNICRRNRTFMLEQQERPGSPRGHPADRCRCLTTEAARAKLGADESRLYQLIWNALRRLPDAAGAVRSDHRTIVAATPNGRSDLPRQRAASWYSTGSCGWRGVSSEDQLLPDWPKASRCIRSRLQPTQHFTQPPPRFTEARLVKELEQLGIGRPSTYARIIQTIQDREYVEQMDRRFHATHARASIVTDKLIQAFPRSWMCSSRRGWN